MKILSLRLKNLNSLIGEWKIDFTAPEYEADGMFLISGPTGSGKTTILDAICLALYGRTPRLETFSINVNEMLPRGQRECMAEITFETDKGRFRSMWSQARTGKKAGKPFQQSQFCLENADSGEVIAKNTEGKIAIQRILGMQFEQFTRSMLLAQGNFAAFLQSDEEERAAILEQITGTDIYSRISLVVFETEKQKKEEITRRQQEIDDVEVLAEEDLARLVLEQKDYEKQEKEYRIGLEAQNQLVDWKRKRLRLEEEIKKLLDEETAWLEENKAFAPMRTKLAMSARASRLEPAYALLCENRAKFREQQDKITACEKEFSATCEARKKAEKELQDAGQARAAAEQIFNDAREKLGRAEVMDKMIREKGETLAGWKTDEQNSRSRMDACSSNQAIIAQGLEVHEKRQAELAAWLLVHARDKNIAPMLPLLERYGKEIAALQNEIGNNLAELEKERQSCAAAEAAFDRTRTEIGQIAADEKIAADELKLLENALADILSGDDMDGLREILDRLRLQRQQMLAFQDTGVAGLRANLADNAPCPVCGSLHHPFAAGDIPGTDELDGKIAGLEDRLKKGNECTRKIAAAEKSLAALAQKKMALCGENDKTAARVEIAKNRLQVLQNGIGGLEKRQQAAGAECARAFAEFGLAANSGVAEGIRTLRARYEEWNKNNSGKDALENSIEVLRIKKKEEEGKYEALVEQYKVIEGRGKTLQQDYDKIVAERKQEFGDLNAGSLKSFEADLAKRKAEEEAARARDIAADRKYTAQETELKTLRESVARIENEIASRLENLKKGLEEEKFADEEEFAGARLSREEQERLQRQDEDLQKRKAGLQTMKSEKETEYDRVKELDLAAEPLEALEQRQRELGNALAATLENIGSVKSRLEMNAKNIDKIGVKKTELEKLKADHQVYAELKSLIGSSDGKKFKIFAQGLTFKVLVANANRQLARMNNRYFLQTHPDKPLELKIIDTWQAGEVRATSNLSGGESFIVSLALALGLSSMGSKKTRIDSLFLDEGFGTLDENSLETTLAALDSLKREGKLIGIISHVEMLQERIGTKIEVGGTGGRSSLKGPGCTKM